MQTTGAILGRLKDTGDESKITSALEEVGDVLHSFSQVLYELSDCALSPYNCNLLSTTSALLEAATTKKILHCLLLCMFCFCGC